MVAKTVEKTVVKKDLFQVELRAGQTVDPREKYLDLHSVVETELQSVDLLVGKTAAMLAAKMAAQTAAKMVVLMAEMTAARKAVWSAERWADKKVLLREKRGVVGRDG